MGAVVLATSLTTHAFAGTPLAAHRAVYDISLKKAEQRSGISGVTGRMVIEFAGNTCDGWTVNFRMVNNFNLGGGKKRTLDSRSSMWESGTNEQMRYVQSQYVDSNLQEEKELRANLSSGKKGGTGAITKPNEEAFDLPENVYFPIDHQLKLVKAAEAGQNRDETLVYDGSDGTAPTVAITFIGNRQKKLSQNTEEKLKAVNTLEGWPITISYYKIKDDEQVTPDYQISMQLFENGVSGDMVLNYGDFVLDAKLSNIEMLEMPECK